MDPPPPPPHHPNNEAQNEAHGVSPLNEEGFSFFQPQIQLGRESAPPVVHHDWVAGTRAWMGGASPIYQDYLQRQCQAYLQQQRRPYLELQWQAYLAYVAYLDQERQSYLAYLEHQRLAYLQQQRRPYLELQRQAYLAYVAYLDQYRQAYLAYMEYQRLAYLVYLEQQRQAFVDQHMQAFLQQLQASVEQQVLQAYLQQQQQLQPVVEHEEAPPVVDRGEAPPVVKREVEVPSTVSSNPGLSGNLRSESEAIGPVESTVPCSDTSVSGTVESAETTATNQSPSSSGTVCPAPSSTDIPPTQDTVPSTVSSNPGLSENVRPESDAVASVESTVPCGDTSVSGTVESTTATNQENPTEEVQVNPPVEGEQQLPPVDLEVIDVNNPQAKSVPADPADGETLSSQEGIRLFSSPGRGLGRGRGRGNSRQRSNASVEKTYEEHMKDVAEKRKPLEALKAEERKVDPKEFESLQQLKGKRSDEGFYIKGSKDKKKKKD